MPDVLAAPYPLVDLAIIPPWFAAVYFNLPFLSYSEIGFCPLGEFGFFLVAPPLFLFIILKSSPDILPSLFLSNLT